MQITKDKESGSSIQAEVLAVHRTMLALSSPVSGLFTELSTLAAQFEMLNDDIPLTDESCFGALSAGYGVKGYGQDELANGENNPIQHAGAEQTPASFPVSDTDSNEGSTKRAGRRIRPASSVSKSGLRDSSVSTAPDSNRVIAKQSERLNQSRPSSQDSCSVIGSGDSGEVATEVFKPVFSLSRPRTKPSAALQDDKTARVFKSVKSDESNTSTVRRCAEMKRGETASVSAQQAINERQRDTASACQFLAESKDVELNGHPRKSRNRQGGATPSRDAMERIAYLAESLLKPSSATQTEKQAKVSRPNRAVHTNVTPLAQTSVTQRPQLHTTATNNTEPTSVQLNPGPLNHVSLKDGQQVISTAMESAPAPLPQAAMQPFPDSKTLTEMVNDTLVEQARRNGVDLS